MNVHSKYNGSAKAAIDAHDPKGLAVLGFFIEVSNAIFIILLECGCIITKICSLVIYMQLCMYWVRVRVTAYTVLNVLFLTIRDPM